MVNNRNFGQKSTFWSKIEILVKNRNFGHKSKIFNICNFLGCDPVTTKYKAKISRNGNGGLSIVCANTLNAKQTNNGDCKRSLCECDKQFADSFAANFEEWSADTWNLEENGTYDAMCVRNSRGSRALGTGPDSCCGNYPSIRAYNSATHTCIDGEVTSDNM